jgi:spermidine synthase
MAHGINTTIVEIDPVVHDFATKYFALPPGHTAVIKDAVTYASKLAQSEQTFDYIVHDVFTGGAEPVDLFTLEFLQDLHLLLKPEGVIALVSSPPLLPLKLSLTQPELRWRPPPSFLPNRNQNHQDRLP